MRLAAALVLAFLCVGACDNSPAYQPSSGGSRDLTQYGIQTA